MNNNWILWLVIAAIVVAGGWFVFKGGGKTAVDGPVKIGVILPMTGDAAVYGEPLSKVLQLAVDAANAEGGINGNNLELIIEDAKCDGASAVNAAQKLVNIDQVEVIIGGFCSSESLSAVPVAEQGKVAMISPGSSSPKLTGISPYFVRNYPSDSTQGAVLANIAYTDKGWKKVAFLQEQTDYALGVYEAFKTEFERLGGVVSNEAFPTETTDFRSLLAKVREQNPDALFLSTQTPAVTVRIVTQLGQIGWDPALFVTDIVPGDPVTVTENAAALEGALAAEFGVDPASNPKFAAADAAYTAKYGEEMPYKAYAQTVYDSVLIVRDAVKAVGYDGEKIAQWLRTSVKNWEGITGLTTIASNGDPLTGHRPIVITGGKVVPYVK